MAVCSVWPNVAIKVNVILVRILSSSSTVLEYGQKWASYAKPKCLPPIFRRFQAFFSHYRKGKVAAARQDATGVDGDKTATAVTVKGSDPSMRPWSAHESRLNSDPVFHMRQRHWEVRTNENRK